MPAADVGTTYGLVTEDRPTALAALTRGEGDGLLPAASEFMDEFATFLGEIGLLPLLNRFPDHRKRQSIAPAFFCNTLLHKALFRLDSRAQIDQVLFHSPAVLRKLGFNFRQINEGFYAGTSQRPFNAEALADFFAAIKIQELFSHQVKVSTHLVKRCPELADEGVAVLDANTSTVPPGHRARPGIQYKVCALGLRSRGRLYPLLWHFTERGKGEDGDLTQGKLLIARVLKHWPPGTIKRLLVDRGFTDGGWVSQLKEQGIDTVIGLRSDMVLYEDMIGLSQLEGTIWTSAPQRRLCRLTDLNTWDACTVPLQGIVVRDVYPDGAVALQGIVTTDLEMTASQVHENCRDRWAIEESFMDLTRYWNIERFGSCRHNVAAAQLHFTFRAYTLLHLYMRRSEDAQRRGRPSPVPFGGREVVAYWRDCYVILLLSELVAIVMGPLRRLGGKPRDHARRSEGLRRPAPVTQPPTDRPPTTPVSQPPSWPIRDTTQERCSCAENLSVDHLPLPRRFDWALRWPQVQGARYSTLTVLPLELLESRDLSRLGQAQNRSKLSFGATEVLTAGQLQQETEHGLGQTEDVQRLGDPSPAQPVQACDLGPAVDHAFIEQALEPKSQFHGVIRGGTLPRQ